MQPPNAEPRWSADRLWWWDGARWIPAGQAPIAPPPPPPPAPPITPPLPPAYAYLPPAYTYVEPKSSRFSPFKPTPGLRVFLIVMLAIVAALNGFIGGVGTIAVAGGDTEPVSIALWLAFVIVFLVSAGGLAGVLLRRAWGRWLALASGIALSVTFVGAPFGVPIIVAAARAPLDRAA